MSIRQRHRERRIAAHDAAKVAAAGGDQGKLLAAAFDAVRAALTDLPADRRAAETTRVTAYLRTRATEIRKGT